MTTQTSFARLAALTVALLASASAFADPTIVNGSFESQILADGTRYTGLIDGWIKTFHGPVALVSGQIYDNNDLPYGVTPFGNNYVGLDQRANGFLGGVSQTISGFVAGQTYALTLYVADSDGGVAPQLDILFSDNAGTTFLDSRVNVAVGGPYGAVIGFTQVVTMFTATVSGDTTLSLYNTGTGFNAGSISLDNISIATVAAVPEPGTLGSMLLGLGVIGGGFARRRRSKAIKAA